MNAHAANALGHLDLGPLVKEKQIVLLFGFRSSVDAVHQSLKCVLLIRVAATHDYETPAFGDEPHHLAKYLSPFGLEYGVIGNLPLAGGELPGVELM